MTTAETNKDVVRRFFAAYAAGAAAEIRACLADDFVAHGMPPGYANDADGMVKLMVDMHASMKDCSNQVEDLLGDGERVAARFTTRFVHAGDLMGARATGRPVTVTGMEMYRLAGGRIAELWGEYNMGALFGQGDA